MRETSPMPPRDDINNLHYTARELAGKPGMPGTKSAVIRMAKRENWQSRDRTGRGGGREYPLSTLPKQTQIALLMAFAPTFKAPPQPDDRCRSKKYDAEALWGWFDGKTNVAREEAARRLELVNKVVALRLSGMSETAARKQVSAAEGCPYRTLIRYCKAVAGYEKNDWWAALCPGSGGRRAQAAMNAAAWGYFKADFLRQDRGGPPTAEACYERLKRAAKQHGWAVPSLKTIKRRIRREIPANLRTLLRRGADAYEAATPSQERDRTVFYALEAVNGDGYQFSKYCLFESGEVCQPKTWYWQDLYSSKVLAWRTDVSENKDMIRLATGDLVEKWGIPAHFWLDNTRAAANKDMTGRVKNRYRFKVKEDEPMGLIPRMGADVHWTTPGHGQAKPIERAFGIGGLGEYIDKHPQFAGRGSQARPIPIAEFEQIMTVEVAAFNARRGRRGKIAAGQSYDAVFNASYARSVIKKATAKQRAMWLLAPAPVTCNRSDGTLKIMDNRYWCEELAEFKGQKLTARFDPANLHAGCYVETLDGRPIGQAECILAAGFNDRDAAREIAKQKARRKKDLQKIAEAEIRISALEAAKLLPKGVPEHDAPEPAAVMPVFEPVMKRAVGSDIEPDEEEQDETAAFILSVWEQKKRDLL